MRTNARSLQAAVAALFLASTAVAVSSCAHPVGPQSGQAVPVKVTENPATHKYEMSKKIIQLSFGNKDWAEWSSPNGRVYVTFKDESPFDSPPVYEKGVLKSGPPKAGTVGKNFEYTAELELSPTNRVPIDPRIEVIP
jgi:hypothetical protein